MPTGQRSKRSFLEVLFRVGRFARFADRFFVVSFAILVVKKRYSDVGHPQQET